MSIRHLIGDVDWAFGCMNLAFKRKDVGWKCQFGMGYKIGGNQIHESE